MTPKQMIEGQVAEFRHLQRASEIAFNQWEHNAKAMLVQHGGRGVDSIINHDRDVALQTLGGANAYKTAADRLESLLILKGWE